MQHVPGSPSSCCLLRLARRIPNSAVAGRCDVSFPLPGAETVSRLSRPGKAAGGGSTELSHGCLQRQVRRCSRALRCVPPVRTGRDAEIARTCAQHRCTLTKPLLCAGSVNSLDESKEVDTARSAGAGSGHALQSSKHSAAEMFGQLDSIAADEGTVQALCRKLAAVAACNSGADLLEPRARRDGAARASRACCRRFAGDIRGQVAKTSTGMALLVSLGSRHKTSASTVLAVCLALLNLSVDCEGVCSGADEATAFCCYIARASAPGVQRTRLVSLQQMASR